MAAVTTLPAAFVSGNVLTAAQMNDLRGAFRVLQVVSTTKTDTFSASVASGANTAVTGLSVSITPSLATSKILVTANVTGASSVYLFGCGIARNASLIGLADAAGNRQRTGAFVQPGSATTAMASASLTFLDSPATTSATTYAIYIIGANDATRTYYVNQSNTDTNTTEFARATSSITVMEISA